MMKRMAASLACVAALLATACTSGDGRTPLIVYSPHGPELLEAFEQRFEAAHPDVDVQWVDMGSQEALDRVRSEKANPQADVWFGAPRQLFETAAEQDLLQPYSPAWAATVKEESDPQGRWLGVYYTPEVIAFNTEAVDSASAPHDWNDLLDPRWKGKVLIRDPLASGTMRTIFGMMVERSLRATGDTAQGFQWLRRLDGQTREYVLNPTMLYQKLARRDGVVTVWDMPDIELLRSKTGYPIGYLYPSSGTPMVVDGIAVVKGAPHPELAKEFVDFVGSPEGMALAAKRFFRLPVRSDLPTDSLPPALQRAREQIVPEPMDWNLLQEHGSEWMRYWDEHVRGTGG
ncbi:MAG TPA: extracellular solute-binding protein [Longimicrobiaceae bacterium]|nr:extracellular solute-binding protein [Longimicrobiaceae bacterium]